MGRNNKRRRSRNKGNKDDEAGVTRSDKEEPRDEDEKDEKAREGTSKAKHAAKATTPPDDSVDADSSSSSDDDSLVFEGIVEKERDLDNYESSDSDEDQEKKPSSRKGNKNVKSQKAEVDKEKNKQKKRALGSETSDDESDDDDGELEVDFMFCDMNMDNHFHGIKTLLGFEPLHAPHSSQLSDYILDNVEVGTLVTTEDDPDHNVYAFASVLNLGPDKDNKSMYGSKPCISKLIKLCIDRCPSEYQTQLTKLLSPKSQKAKAVGLLLQARMVNVPLTIVEVLHQQLIKDMEWAGAGGEKKKKRRPDFDFGTFLVLAPCSRDHSNHALYYKYVEDEIFASNAEFHFEFDVMQKTASAAQREAVSYNLCSVLAISRKAYHASLKEFSKLVPPPSSK
jgi:hypothetical protein